MNAHRVNAASKYIYPADYAGLYLFNEAVYSKSPNTLFKVRKQKSSLINGQRCVIVQLECINASQFFRDYMTNLGMLQSNDIIVDTIFIRETEKRKCLTFNWTKIKGENLQLAAIADTSAGARVNIRSGAGMEYAVVGKLDKTKKVVIDEYSRDAEWVKCYTIDHQCNIIQGYVNKKFLKSKETFFTLGIFGSLGLIVALIVLVVVGFPLIFVNGIVSAFRQIPFVGIILCVGLILGLLYSVYQLLDNILFELFLINLPTISKIL
jgi:hypothetical protein